MSNIKHISPSSPDRFQTTIVGLFNLLVLTVPLFFLMNTEELFEFNKMILTYFLTIAICSVWIVRMVVQRRIIFRSTKLDIPVLIFLLSQLLSTLFSIHPYTSLLGYYTRFHGGLVSSFCYASLYYAFVSNFEKKYLKGFFTTLFAAGALTSFYGVLEHFGHSPSCIVATGGHSFGVDCWVQDVKNRVFATFGQPNWLAAYLLMLIPLALSTTLSTSKRWLQVVLVALNVLLFSTILFTRSRSGILALAIELVFFSLLVCWSVWLQNGKQNWRKATQPLIPIVVTAVLFFILILTIENPFSEVFTRFLPHQSNPTLATVVAAVPTPEPTVNRLENGISDSGDIRKVVWTGAIKVWQRYPIFGSGVETFGYSYYQDRPQEHNLLSEWDFLYNKAHNEFLNFLATTGLVGFISYCGLLLCFFLYGFKAILKFSRQKNITSATISIALLTSVFGLSISNFFGFSTVMVTILLFLFFGTLDLITEEKEMPEFKSQPLLSWQYTVLVLVGLLSMTLLYRVYSYWQADMEYTRGKAMLQQGYVQEGLPLILSAIQRTPQEALFYDELSVDYAAFAVQFAQAGQATAAAELADRSVEAQVLTQQLNPRQINYYKTGARAYLTLAQIDPKYVKEAEKVLLIGQPLAPTDPKIVYNLGLVELGLGKNEEGITYLKKALTLKPNYDSAREQLAQEYEKEKKYPEALEQYRYLDEQAHATSPVIKEKITELTGLLKQK